MAKKPTKPLSKPPAKTTAPAKTTPPISGVSRNTAPRRSRSPVWFLMGDATLAVVAVLLALSVALVGPATVATPRPLRLVASGDAAAAGGPAARIDGQNQWLVGDKPCLTISACLAELTTGGAGGRVHIAADGEAPFATLGALVDALARDGHGEIQVTINR